jgi:hypothetical protein
VNYNATMADGSDDFSKELEQVTADIESMKPSELLTTYEKTMKTTVEISKMILDLYRKNGTFREANSIDPNDDTWRRVRDYINIYMYAFASSKNMVFIRFYL